MCWQLLPQQFQTTIQARTQTQAQEQQPEIERIDCVQHEPEDRFWVAYGSGPGVKVLGYPSKGGIYVLRDCFGVELDFLGLDRFNDTERPSTLDPDWQAKEDAHCDRMRRLGATWWRSESDEFLERGLERPESTDDYLQVGWPAAGGVWVLHTTWGNASDIGAARIHNAHDMEERCRWIEKLGGVFYADPKDCPYLDLP
ncbi:hypothetical protein IFM46972_03696 [Aspergillus udagawae]|uniref:Uncharacterized protein n=1 Tax=Aspergillus udagawae TaxID=91492 RepID=A0A8H3NMQ0_9EURO|nr:hypothetical protein IFM46972_03696 [Aspergillus udagawae]